MATFSFGRDVNIHWNGFEVEGPANTVFSIPDQLYEEFEADFRHVEPSLTWIDTNEFQTLENSVSAAALSATFPIALTTSSTGKTISISSSTSPNGYLLSADGSGGVIFTPASTSGLTSVVGVSPISAVVSGGTVSVSLDASYQTAGTYVTSVVGTSPVSASGTTAITVSVDQALLSVADASTASTVRTYVKNASGSTITKGSAVYVTGADGTNALIGLASATSDAASSKTLGILASTLTNNAFGYVIENGQLSNIDTSAASAGSSVWLGSTPGSLVFDSPPAEPNHSVYLGVVTKANVSTGEVLVKVQNGYELDELHDVFTTGVSTSLPLVYNSTSSGWIAQALTSVGIADNAVVAAKISDGSVTSSKLGDGAVVAAKITDGSVTSAKIADNAVVAAKIAAGAVGSSAIGSGAVVAAGIAAGAVGSAAIADNAIVAAKIAAAAVGTAALSSGSAANGTVLTANGSGGATFQTVSAREGKLISGITTVSTSSISSFTGEYAMQNLRAGSINVVVSSVTTLVPGSQTIRLATASTMTKILKDAPGTSYRSQSLTGNSTQPRNLATDGQTIVFGGPTGIVWLSIDGNTFQTVSLGTSFSANFQYYGGGLFVVGGASGNLFTSPDGYTWTSRTSGFSASSIRDGTFGGGTHVVVGDSGKISYSTDGSTWTNTNPTGAGFASVAYGNGLFVAVGSQNSGTPLWTSASGSSWTQRAAGTGGANLDDVAYGNGLWIAISDSTCSKSINGTSWTAGSTPTGAYIDYINSYWVVQHASTAKISSDGASTFTNSTTPSSAHNFRSGGYYAKADAMIFASVRAADGLTSVTTTSSGVIDVLFSPVSYQSITS